jgi:hypothetical protein
VDSITIHHAVVLDDRMIHLVSICYLEFLFVKC